MYLFKNTKQYSIEMNLNRPALVDLQIIISNLSLIANLERTWKTIPIMLVISADVFKYF